MSRLEILGAGGGEVTGSANLLTTRNGGKLLIDSGLCQGRQENDRYDRRNKNLNGLDPSELDAVLITHGHLDHVGRLPLLANTPAPIFMTPATYDIAQIALRNANSLSPGLYPKGSVEKVLQKTTRVPYDSTVAVDGVMVTFKDAGHILGSSTLVIDEKGGERIVFSGDLGNSPSRLVKPTELIDGADIVVMETTYGDRNHTEDSPVEVIMDAVERIKKNKGTLLLPSFAIDRTQVVLSILKELSKNGKLGNIPVFLDSPMGIEVTRIYDSHHSLLNDEAKEKKDPFGFPGLTKTYSANESNSIHHRRGAKIIIAGSGMMAGGRILKHAEYYLQDKNSVLLFVGFAANDTPGRMIMEGERELKVGENHIFVNGTVLGTSALSAHADQNQLLDWVRHIKGGNKRLRSVVLVHGNNNARNAFAETVRSELQINDVLSPNEREVIDFDQNEH